MLTCTYCGKELETNHRDHVPPRQVFPRPLPSNLVTVPSCRKCNGAFKLDEEYFLATILFTDAGTTEAGQKLWSDTFGRGLKKNDGLRSRVERGIRYADVETETGIKLGNQAVHTPDYRRLEQVSIKIAQGLHVVEYGEALPPDGVGYFARFVVAGGVYEILAKLMPMLSKGKLRWPGVFDYRFGRVDGNHLLTAWIMRMYETAVFMVFTAPTEKLADWEETAKANPRRIFVPEGFGSAG